MSIDAQTIELWINNLGRSYSNLLSENLLPNIPLKKLYENSHSLEIEPCSGIELVFWFFTQRFESIYIRIQPADGGVLPPYQGELPLLFSKLKSYGDVREVLGLPYESQKKTCWVHEGVEYRSGGWDHYELDVDFPGCRTEFHYDEHMMVWLLAFSVFDKES